MNYDKLDNNELVKEYKRIKHDFISSKEGSLNESSLERQLIIISKEIDIRNIDLRKYYN